MVLLDNALSAKDSDGDLLDLEPEMYRAVNQADRPGEDDYDGYDIASLALDLASRWDNELVDRAGRAVDPSLGLEMRPLACPEPRITYPPGSMRHRPVAPWQAMERPSSTWDDPTNPCDGCSP